MAFWNRDELPPELAGKDPKDIAAALKKAEEIRTAAEKTLADAKEMEVKLTTQTTEFDAMKAKLTELEADPRLQTQQQQQQVEEPASPWADPEKFVDQRVQGLAGVALASGMMTAKMYFMQQLSTRDAKIFKQYEKEVEAGVNGFIVTQRVMPQSWLNMFLYVKGLHEADIKKAESENSSFFSETPSRGQTPEPEPTDVLSAEEEEICRKFHYDPKTYLERRKTATLSQSAKGAYARYPVPTTK
jgi:hypothetical protein